MDNPFEKIEQKLTEISQRLEYLQQQKEISEEWLDLEQLLEYLPGNPAKSTIYAKVSKGEIPHRKYARRLIFSKNEIDNYIQNAKKN